MSAIAFHSAPPTGADAIHPAVNAVRPPNVGELKLLRVLGLDQNKASGRAAKKICTWLRVLDCERANRVLGVFKGLPEYDYKTLKRELNVIDMEKECVIMLQEIRDFFLNAAQAYESQGHAESFEDSVRSGLLIFAKIYQMARDHTPAEQTGVFVVNVSSLAEAARNPAQLSHLKFFLEVTGMNARVVIGEKS